MDRNDDTTHIKQPLHWMEAGRHNTILSRLLKIAFK